MGRDVRYVRGLHIFTSQLIYKRSGSFICMRSEKDPDRFLEMDDNRKTVRMFSLLSGFRIFQIPFWVRRQTTLNLCGLLNSL